MKFYKLLPLLFLLVISACREDSTNTAEIDVSYPGVVDIYTIGIQGRILDVAGEPISNAEVSISDQSVFSNENGVYKFDNVLAPDGVHIKAQVEGFFTGGATIIASSNQVYHRDINLIPYQDFVEVSSNDDIDFVLDEGARIRIEGGSIANSDGSVYAGDLTVNVSWLDPLSPRLFELMPGSLRALQEGELRSLLSYGMLAVDMVAPNGDALNLVDGATATLNYPIPQAILAEAPETIDLWYFEESDGYWVHEGTATKVGNEYVAEVSHFSWWNCDVPFDFGFLCIELTDIRGVAIPDVLLELETSNLGVATGLFAEDGVFCGLIPLNENIDMQIITQCGTVLYQDVIGPFTSTDNTQEIQLPEGNSFLQLNVSGQVTDCDGNAVTNGYISINTPFSAQVDFLDENGAYDLTVTTCPDQVFETTVTAYNLDALTQESSDFEMSDEDVVVDLQPCNETFTSNAVWTDADGAQIAVENCNALLTPAETMIRAFADDESVGLIIGFKGNSEGTFEGNIIQTGTNIVSNVNGADNLVTITISEYGEVGGYVVGSFEVGSAAGIFTAERIQ